jgi:MYXO-CTERM domain-containing protein
MLRRATLVLGLLAGCGPELPRVGAQQEALIGAPPDTDHPAVVALVALAASNYFLCSGTVVSPHVVLTAAHCVTGGDVTADTTFYLYDGPVVPALSGGPPTDPGFHPVRRLRTYPQFDANAAMNAANMNKDSLPVFDIAVAVSNDVMPAAPMFVQRRQIGQSDFGTVFHNVGYGRSDPSTSNSDGTRRHADATLMRLAPDLLELDGGMSSICRGDSGGPALLTTAGTERVAGVHSWIGQAGTCTGTQYDTRVDAYVLPFIDPEIENADPGWLADAGEQTPTPTPQGQGCAATAGAPALLLAGLALRRRRR